MRKLHSTTRYIYCIQLVIAVCLGSSSTSAQKNSVVNYVTIKPKLPVDKSTWCVVEQAATFPGGIAAWTQYLTDSTNYPDVPFGKRGVMAIRIQFIISKEGRITEVKSLDKANDSFTVAAISVIKNSPAWNPAKRNGRPISFGMVQGFQFIWEPPTLQKPAACNDTTTRAMLL